VKIPDEIPKEIDSLALEIKGLKAHYLKAGSGPAVVLLHGGASDSRDWLQTMAGLSGRFTFYAPDFPGFGKNERNEAGYYLSDFIEFIEEFILKLGLENPDIVGHSFGARVGAGVAIRGKVKVRRLVLSDAAGFGKVTLFGSSLMTVFWALHQVFRKTQPYPRFLSREGESIYWLCLDELPSLKTPTLLIWKQLDPYMPISLAYKALKLIPGATLKVVPGFGHAPNKQDSEIFNKLVLDFLGDKS
jgi:pimeloyl-ACP methyl ester carboxylesterase